MRSLNDITLEKQGDLGKISVMLQFRYVNGYGDRHYYVSKDQSASFHAIDLNSVARTVLEQNDVIVVGQQESWIVQVCPKCSRITLYNAKAHKRQEVADVCTACATGLLQQSGLELKEEKPVGSKRAGR